MVPVTARRASSTSGRRGWYAHQKWHGPFVKMGHAYPDIEGEYRDDKKDGLFTYYSGETKVGEGYYKAGKETGRWTHWYEDGDKKNSGEYVNGKKHGLWEQYSSNGALTYACYANGKEVWSDPAGKGRACP